MVLNNCIATIKRPKLNGVGEHWGVLLPNKIVAHLTNDNGVEKTSINQFAKGLPVTIVRQESFHKLPEILSRLDSEFKRPIKYDLISNNCETFANRVMGYKPESKQIQNALIFTVITTFVYLNLN